MRHVLLISLTFSKQSLLTKQVLSEHCWSSQTQPGKNLQASFYPAQGTIALQKSHSLFIVVFYVEPDAGDWLYKAKHEDQNDASWEQWLSG